MNEDEAPDLTCATRVSTPIKPVHAAGIQTPYTVRRSDGFGTYTEVRSVKSKTARAVCFRGSRMEE